MKIEGFNKYDDGLNARSIILEVREEETIAGAKGDPIMENDPLSELFILDLYSNSSWEYISLLTPNTVTEL